MGAGKKTADIAKTMDRDMEEKVERTWKKSKSLNGLERQIIFNMCVVGVQ